MKKANALMQGKRTTSPKGKRTQGKLVVNRRELPRRQTATSPHQANPFPIVGVGASAGGLEAFRQLLEHLPLDSGMAFVLVQHLDPAHESALTEILARATSMPVQEATNQLRVRPNHVYVIPPNVEMRVSDGTLRLTARALTPGAHHSIDQFFESLAQDQHEQAIGVILSGTATDGTLGLEAIKGEGGITFAQDASAKYDAMPHSAIAAGAVDFILAPEAIARELKRIAQHPYVKGTRTDLQTRRSEKSEASSVPSAGEQTLSTAKNGFKSILVLLRNHRGVDFSLYKPTTIQRRITRRMVLQKLETMEAYADFLRENEKELDALFSDLLINVTSFFRNPEAFEALKREVFPTLIQERGAEGLRVWVPGCSTGQEAYSIAMAYLEFCDTIPQAPRMQVFATDLNEALLVKARQGLYTRGLVQNLSPERLRRFFVEEEGGYRVTKSLRDLCLFARHNFLSDPPFSRMDLISCRNLLIYIEPALQNKVLPSFHYALKPHGFLFLGASESIGPYTALFKPVDKKLRIFSRKSGVTPNFNLPRSEMSPENPRPSAGARGKSEPRALAMPLDPQREADRVTIHRYTPSGVLVNADLQILQFRGTTGAYIEPAAGKASLDLLKMVRPELMLPLRDAINKVKKTGQTLRVENVLLSSESMARRVNLEVIALKNLKERCYLVFFEEQGRPVPNEPRAAGPGRKQGGKEDKAIDHLALRRRNAELERELADTRDYLQTIQEQNEAANEELQASNEEATSANEELQSMNEELETSKEELESTNEELATVNDEIASRNLELSQLNSDLINLHASIQTPILVLSRDLSIRRFTPLAQKVFNLLASDVGRPLGGIKHNLAFPELESFIAEVIRSLIPREREVQDREGNWYLLRVRPYVTMDDKIDGAVLLLVDINARKQAEQRITEARDFAHAVIEAVPPLLILEPDLRVRSANESFYRTFGVAAGQTEGRLIYELGNGQWNIPALRKLLGEVLPRSMPFQQYEVTHEFEGLGRRTMIMSGRKVDSLGAIVLSIEDITQRKQAEEQLRLHLAVLQSAANAIVITDRDGLIQWVNPALTTLTGYSAEEVIGQNPRLFKSGKQDRTFYKQMWETIQAGKAWRGELINKRKDGSLYPEELTITPIMEGNGQISHFIAIKLDISERKQLEEALADRREELERLVVERTSKLNETIGELLHFSYTITHNMRAPLRAMAGFGELLLTEEPALSENGKKYARRISESATRMDMLITDALDYAKLSQEAFELRPVDVGAFLRGMLRSYPHYQSSAAKISVAEPMPQVLANEAGLTQCFSNLLNNAIKFVQPGQTPEIRIWAEERPQSLVRFWVEDNGVGIPADQLQKIFGMFQRLNVHLEGTGIGLALVKKAAERMGGRVGVESEEGKGSRFWLEFKKTSVA